MVPKSARITRRQALQASVAAAGFSAVCSAAPEGWSDSDLIQPKQLADRLANKNSPRAFILHVGFNVLYKSKHIPGSLYAGPGNKPEGLELLKSTVASIGKDREIILYCGCCPWDQCPNMKPAVALLRQLGYKNVKAVLIEKNFAANWVQMGYPVEGNTAGS